MTMFSETTLFSHTPMHDRYWGSSMDDRYGTSGVAFALLATVVLVALAVLSIMSGVAPVADPVIMAP